MSLKLRHIITFAICALSLCFFASVNVAYADSGLKVYVGYTGGPYYKKTEISEAEIKAMSDGKTYEYSTFDSGKYLIKAAGKGPTITSIFTRAGVDVGNLKRFYFSTSDGYVNDDGGEGYNAWYYSTLTQTRYYYPKLGQYWDFQDKCIAPSEDVDIDQVMTSSAVATKSILAYESAFYRARSEADFERVPALTQYEGLRLMTGQSSYTDPGAFSFAQSVKAITCILGSVQKTPTINLEVNGQTGGTFTADVGDVVKIKASILADDPEISKWGIYDIRWTISDSSVADFVRNSAGEVIVDDDGTVSLRVFGKGDIVVSASFGDSPFSEYVTDTSISGTGTGEGGGNGSGKGTSDGDGEGDKEGEGTGNLEGKSATPISFDSQAAVNESPLESSIGSGGGGTETSTAAFKLNVAQTPQAQELDENIMQALMLDFNTYGAPLLFLLFSCITFGVVWRVKKTERDKDPFMNL